MRVAPDGADEAAAALRDAGRAVRIVGGATKLRWGRPVHARVELSTAAMAGVVEHHVGDLTAVVRAGTTLQEAQSVFRAAGQMLALDPPEADAATLGGVVAAGDTGPLRHRYGAGRDLVVGIQVVLGDGTVARAGGRVIKNVAGYDLPKLFAGSFGSLGLLTEFVVRLHPVPGARATAVGRTGDPAVLQRAAVAVGSAPFELESFDVRADADGCSLLARVAGMAVADRAERVAEAMRAADLDAEVESGDDEPLWDHQRNGQRGELVVRVSAVRGELERVVRAAVGAGGELVGRASLGVSWVRLPAADGVDAVARLRRELATRPCVVLDAPDAVREAVDPWGPIEGEALMRRVKARFDPSGVCNPGLFGEGW
ncbi:MAG: FAD-binding oxidoreductase [Actinomycetota bacterium]